MDNLIDIKQIWTDLLLKIEADIGPESLDLWIRPINPLFIEENVLKLEVPNSIIYERIKEKYEEKIIQTLHELLQKNLTLQYSIPIVSAEESAKTRLQSEVQTKQQYISVLSEELAMFNPNYTFESFIVGDSNRFAYATAHAVSQKPGRLYNPFFIYSSPGLGKTHLLHAIGHEIFKQNPSAKIIYTSCETFVNEFIEAIQNKTPSPETFRNKYRKLNCLLLDDIQFLVEKEKSEEEFFYTFNALFESQNQVIVTSDRPEKELQLSERLKSRLRSGMSADIKPPDLETRIAILRKKREIYKISMPDDIIVYIAERVKTSIRELEGCLIRVDGFSSSMKVQPTIDIVKDVIKDYITSEETSKITIDAIQNVVANHFHLDIKDLKSPKRTENIAYARQIAMYLACKLTDMSLPSIGEAFDKDHTTVIYARDKISQMLHTDPYFNGEINKLISKIKSVSG